MTKFLHLHNFIPITTSLLTLGTLSAQESTSLDPFNVSTSYETYQNAFDQNGANSQVIQVDLNQHFEFESISNLVPGFHSADSGAASYGNIYSFRGAANTPFFGPATLSLYIDGVPSLDSKSFPLELGRLASIEFIKGGQASAIGQRATAGSIIIETPKPTPARSLDIVTLELGSDNQRGIYLFSQNRIGKTNSAYSLYLYQNRSDGFINNLDDSENQIGMKRHEGAYLRVAIPVTQELSSEISFSWNQARDGEQPYTSIESLPFTTSKTFNGKTNQESYTTAIKLYQNFDNKKATWVSSYTDWELSPYTTRMEIFPGFSLDSNLAQQNKQQTHEFTLTSDDNAPLNWEIGAYRQDRDILGNTERAISDGPIFEQSSFTHVNNNTALRAKAKLHLSETIASGIGIRWENTSQKLIRTNIDPQSIDEENTQGDAFVSFKFSTNLSSSLRVFTSEKPGGFSTYTSVLEYIPFDSEQSRGIELNSEWLNKSQTFGTNLSLYSTNIDGYQIERSFTEGDYFVINAEEVSSHGGEIVLWLQASEKLNLQFSHAYTNTIFESYIDPITQSSFKDNYVPYVPKNTSSIEINYTINENFSIRNNWSFKDDVYFHEGNQIDDTAESYYTGDFWVKYNKGSLSIELGVKNLLNETYISFINSGVRQQVNGTPRQSTARVSLEF